MARSELYARVYATSAQNLRTGFREERERQIKHVYVLEYHPRKRTFVGFGVVVVLTTPGIDV